MKRRSSLALMIALGLAAGSLQAAQPSPGLTGCAAKRSAIENQLVYAKKHNNWGEIRGLEKALKENTDHCTDAGLRQERLAKIEKAKAEIAERQADLAQARAKGDAGKIAKRERKLAESEAELKQAELELEK
ncbi:DUF1090 domain-containing protein [Pseudomonas guariconensis]|uniref:DUF1090 domain-containing protein n=1 Tax=Pseudomonas guariconensis TaxID=1288410 RepID=UPI0018AC11C1|nr:DUF1090 domain-containing protein [Pseudomonas guariconensis]MBF8741112.1 DUF1090 domain-containing protein [Pseudomonas guariconensis]MBF8753019.1 DUF1090 domain-containing protein [Pseudomonas guariconensis]